MDRQKVDISSLNAVNNAMAANDNLSNVVAAQLRNNPSQVWVVHQSAGGAQCRSANTAARSRHPEQ